MSDIMHHQLEDQLKTVPQVINGYSTQVLTAAYGQQFLDIQAKLLFYIETNASETK
jgi:hypothetical protein